MLLKGGGGSGGQSRSRCSRPGPASSSRPSTPFPRRRAHSASSGGAQDLSCRSSCCRWLFSSSTMLIFKAKGGRQAAPGRGLLTPAEGQTPGAPPRGTILGKREGRPPRGPPPRHRSRSSGQPHEMAGGHPVKLYRHTHALTQKDVPREARTGDRKPVPADVLCLQPS